MLLYVGLVVVIGLRHARRNHSTEHFLLGSRSLGPLVTAMSAEASDMSSWLLMGLPGLAYLTGLGSPAWVAIGLAAGTWLNWRFVAVRLRTYSHMAGNAITVPEFFANRFGDRHHVLLVLAAGTTAFFFTVYTSSGFAALGKLFHSLFGFDYTAMMVCGALVVVAYTVAGGFLAESTADLMQGSLMILSLVVVLAAGIVEAGGMGAAAAAMGRLPGYAALLASHERASGGAVQLSWLEIASSLSWGLGYFGMPHVLLRFMAIRDAAELGRSRRIAMAWVVVSLAAAVGIGVVGAAAVPWLLEGAGEAQQAGRSETVFIVMTQLLTRYSPAMAILVGVVLSGILAATMSTSDSQLLITSSAVAKDLYKGVLRRQASDKQVLWAARLTILVVAVIAGVLAADPDSSIFGIVSYAWAGFGAAFGPLMLFALFWPRTNLAGAIAGMTSGFLGVVVWKHWLAPRGGPWAVYELLPAFLFSAGCIVAASLLSAPPPARIQQEFRRAVATAR